MLAAPAAVSGPKDTGEIPFGRFQGLSVALTHGVVAVLIVGWALHISSRVGE